MKDGKIGFGMVGLNWGVGRCEMIQQVPEAELVGVVSRTAERAKAAGEKFGVDWYTDYRELLKRDDLDVLCLWTPSGVHMEQAIDAARAGKHVLTTKPMEITIPRVDAMISACKEAGVRLGTEFMLHYVPDNYALYNVLREGRLGKIYFCEISQKGYRPQWYYEMDGGWRGTWAIDGGGAMMNQCIHAVDLMLWLMGDVAEVTSLTGTFTHKIEAEDTGASLIRFANGAVGTFFGTTSFINDRKPDQYGGGGTRRIEIGGDRGSAVIIDGKMEMWKTVDDAPAPEPQELPAINIFLDFARWVKDPGYDSPTLVKAEQSRKSVEFINAIYQSNRTGKTVKLPLVGTPA
jgi:UDP-N-acetyl-2-amino-2-deoxyglucuronate dehydrogenase